MTDETLAVLITSVILERPTCLLCVTAKVGATMLAVVCAMERIGQTVGRQVHLHEHGQHSFILWKLLPCLDQQVLGGIIRPVVSAPTGHAEQVTAAVEIVVEEFLNRLGLGPDQLPLEESPIRWRKW